MRRNDGVGGAGGRRVIYLVVGGGSQDGVEHLVSFMLVTG